jgi:hypothetical protein
MKQQRSEKLLKYVEMQKDFERQNPTEEPKIRVMRGLLSSAKPNA